MSKSRSKEGQGEKKHKTNQQERKKEDSMQGECNILQGRKERREGCSTETK